MNRNNLYILGSVLICALLFSFTDTNSTAYHDTYKNRISNFSKSFDELLIVLEKEDTSPVGKENMLRQLHETRSHLKSMDFWLRYLDPVAYKKINGPLPVEWETEVFEKFEKPYKRIGSGLSLAELYLGEDGIKKDSLLALIKTARASLNFFQGDSILTVLKTYDHFLFCNRLFLLNLAAIYTTGFECPETSNVVSELRAMLKSVNEIYSSYNGSFPNHMISQEYLLRFGKTIEFVNGQPNSYEQFDHFTFIKDYVNPLFLINQRMLADYRPYSGSYLNYTLNSKVSSIFSKRLYAGQNTKGVYGRIQDEKALREVEELGKLLFFDPILSGNNQRSCASCHKPNQFFTDTSVASALSFDKKVNLPRNSPALVNADFNHLTMLDGKHISLFDQAKDVITNPEEMSGNETVILDKILSCREYKEKLSYLLKFTPTEKKVNFTHITSAIVYFYSRYSGYYSAFDNAMNTGSALNDKALKGFNLFMSKAQCGTCHFVPLFNGVKPPYIGSEFEVLGVPAKIDFKNLSSDKGRYNINPAYETRNAFRTGTVRNSTRTAPYMHNGVFKTLDEVIDFYNQGGGAGRGLAVNNQTLSQDSLMLSEEDKINLKEFIHSLTENIPAVQKPLRLPESRKKELNQRSIGGDY